MFKVNNKNTITRWERCSKLAIKTPEQGQWCFFCEFRAGKCRLCGATSYQCSHLLHYPVFYSTKHFYPLIRTVTYTYQRVRNVCAAEYWKVLKMGIWAPNRLSKHRQSYFLSDFNPFQPSKVFHTETTHLICCATLKLR